MDLFVNGAATISRLSTLSATLAAPQRGPAPYVPQHAPLYSEKIGLRGR